MITGACNFCGKCCIGCDAGELHSDGKRKCLIYNNRMDMPAMLNSIQIWANGCPKYPTAEDFRLRRVPIECSYIYTETETADNEVKLNEWGGG